LSLVGDQAENNERKKHLAACDADSTTDAAQQTQRQNNDNSRASSFIYR